MRICEPGHFGRRLPARPCVAAAVRRACSGSDARAAGQRRHVAACRAVRRQPKAQAQLLPAQSIGSRFPVQAARLLLARHNDDLRRQAARAHRPRECLPDERADAGRRFRAGRSRRAPLRGQDLSAEARPRALRIQSAEPDRARLRRLLAGGARPQARDAGPLSAVADAAALPARRPHRSAERHQRGRGLDRRHLRQPCRSRKSRRSAAHTRCG